MRNVKYPGLDNRRQDIDAAGDFAYNLHRRFRKTPEGVTPCWFGFPLLISPKLNMDRKTLTALLMNYGIDTRPIVSGNMAVQPAVKLFNVDLSMGPFTGAQVVHDRGIFIGCHSKLLSRERIDLLVSAILESLKF